MAVHILYDYQIFTLQQFGGISRYFATLARHAEAVPDIHVQLRLLYTRNGYLQREHSVFNATIGKKLLKGHRKRQKWNRQYLEYKISKGDFDVFHPTYYDPYFLKKLRKPFVVTVHDMIHELFPEYFSPSDPTSRHKRQILERADHIIAISECTKRDLLRFLPLPEEKISVIHHGNMQEDPSLDRTDSKRPPATPPYLLFVGAREGYKNFTRFLEALVPVVAHFPELHILCVGGGNFQVAEEETISRLGLKHKIRQVNCSDRELELYYRGAAAFIYPSLYEGFGLPILEAFRQNCPVLLSDTPCLKEVAGDSALYFNPYDTHAISEAIETILGSDRLRETCSIKGSQRLQQFTLDSCLKKTYQVYRKIAGI